MAKKADRLGRSVYPDGNVRVLASEEAAALLLLRIWRAQGLKYSQRYGLGVEKKKAVRSVRRTKDEPPII